MHCTRRQFGQALLGAALAGAAPLSRLSALAAQPASADPRVVILFFGGGVRCGETIDDPHHRHIPRLWNDLIPRGTLLTNLRVQGTIVHPNCVGAALTGRLAWEDLEWDRPIDHPSIFERYRKARIAPDTDAWALVYASILARVGDSSAAEFGVPVGANILVPPTIPRSAAEQMDALLRAAAASGSIEAEREAAARAAAIARASSAIALNGLRSDPARAFVEDQFARWKRSPGTTSHDAFLTDCAIAAMRRFSPRLLAVAYGEIDCAHYGAWSRYVEAIERTDRLVARIAAELDSLPAYRGQTLLLILPDHGRQLEGPGSPGFLHHGDFYTRKDEDEGCQRTWLLAIGPGFKAAQRVSAPVPHTCVAATALAHLGIEAPPPMERSARDWIRRSGGQL